MSNIYISTPTNKIIKEYLEKWNQLENYMLQENALDKLFFSLVPNNTDISDILIKVSTLNDFYSTNIFSVFTVAKHIYELNIDERLKQRDPSLVNDIANVKIKGKEKYFYSFATKYCSHHYPIDYPIYDSYVEKVLIYFQKRDHFSEFKKSDLKNYKRYKHVILDFINFYQLDYNIKEVDKYLWQVGKEVFPRKYYK